MEIPWPWWHHNMVSLGGEELSTWHTECSRYHSSPTCRLQGIPLAALVGSSNGTHKSLEFRCNATPLDTPTLHMYPLKYGHTVRSSVIAHDSQPQPNWSNGVRSHWVVTADTRGPYRTYRRSLRNQLGRSSPVGLLEWRFPILPSCRWSIEYVQVTPIRLRSGYDLRTHILVVWERKTKYMYPLLRAS